MNKCGGSLKAEQPTIPWGDGGSTPTSPLQFTLVPRYNDPDSNPALRKLFIDITNKYHRYKSYAKVPGRHVNWVIYQNNSVIGCIGIASSPLNLGDRDKYIGWTHKQRLAHIGNLAINYRFTLIKQGLGSKVLGILGKLAPGVWQQRYGEKLILLETMVQPPWTGACYRGAGWEQVGYTKGMLVKRRPSKALLLKGSPTRADRVRRNAWHEGNYKYTPISLVEKQGITTPKLIFVRPLIAGWRKYLIEGEL